MITNGDKMPILCEEFVASNVLLIVQSFYENKWFFLFMPKTTRNQEEIIDEIKIGRAHV